MSFGKTVNLGNSIIGVSILAMPYCFVRTGLLLSILLLMLSALLTRLSCYLLLKSAYLSRRRNFELIVQDVLGPTGRVMAELGLIGFLLGTCVAYFIMIGDLAPKIILELLNVDTNNDLRTICVVALAFFVALPLSLLKKVDSLTSCSLLSMLLYSFLIVKLLFEAEGKLTMKTHRSKDEELNEIVYWNPAGLLTTFPIFCMAMSCQTSIFEIFDASFSCGETDTIKRDTNIITKAIYLCLFAYTTVGLLGYVAFHDQQLHGNLLIVFEPSLTTTLTKIGFIVTLLLSFPLCVFPCRTSVYSLTIGKMKKTAHFQQISTSTTAIGMNTFTDQANHNDTFNDCQDYSDNSDVKQLINECDSKDDKKRDSSIIANNKHNSLHPDLFHLNNIPPYNKTSHLDSNIQTTMNRLTFNQNSSSKIPYKSLLDDCDISMDECHEMSTNDLVYSDHNFVQELKEKDSSIGPSRLYISDFHFRLLTVILIGLTATLSLVFPNIEFILGIIGSTVGTTVCFIIPAYTFIKIGRHNKTETLLAKTLLLIGLSILIFCTYSTLHTTRF